MSRNIECRHLDPAYPLDCSLIDQQIRRHRLELDIESMFFEKRTVPDHHRRIGVKTHPTAVAALDFRRVHHMVEMPVRQQEPVDFVVCKKRVGSLRSVEKQIACGRFQKERIRIKRAAGENLELLCDHDGRTKVAEI